MKHIKTYDEAINEGFLGWLFKKIWRVSYTAELLNHDGEPVSYRSYLTVKAKNEEDAKDKFYEKWDDAIKSFDKEPKVIVGTIKKTDKADKINIEFPKAINKKDAKKEKKKD